MVGVVGVDGYGMVFGGGCGISLCVLLGMVMRKGYEV